MESMLHSGTSGSFNEVWIVFVDSPIVVPAETTQTAISDLWSSETDARWASSDHVKTWCHHSAIARPKSQEVRATNQTVAYYEITSDLLRDRTISKFAPMFLTARTEGQDWWEGLTRSPEVVSRS